MESVHLHSLATCLRIVSLLTLLSSSLLLLSVAPEVMEGNVYTEKIDTYSFGILLTELVTRQMPFHDLAKIASYMDVVDLVLDQGAMPTIPKWCENLLGGVIRQCLSRIPSERPNFTDLIMKLREVADLEDSLYFFAFDLPRLRELMMSSNPSIQSLAASEVAALLSAPHIRRRSTPADLIGSPSLGPYSTGGSVSPMLSPEPPLGGRTPNPNLSSSQGMATLQLPAPLTPLPPTPGAVNLGGLTSPLNPGSAPGSRHANVEGDYWILSNEDAFDFLERFTTLLSSSHREVQLQSCRALRALLLLSSHDRFKRAQDRESVIANGGLGSLLTLLLSPSLSAAAGDVLLLLTEDMNEMEQSTFLGLNSAGLTELSVLVSKDIEEDEEKLKVIQMRMERKRGMLSVVQSCAATSAPKKSLKKPAGSGKKTQRHSMTPLKFSPGGTTPVVKEGEEALSQAEESSEDEDGDETDQVASELLLAQAAATMAQSPAQGVHEGGWDNVGGRGRAETAQVKPGQTMKGGGPENQQNPASPILLEKFVSVNELIQADEGPTEKFTDWYSNIVLSSWTLRYDLDNDAWEMCYAVLLPDELRLFSSRLDEPDEPSFIIRTRVLDPESDEGALIPAKVRMGHKHGMPFCFQVEDCGRIWTFCSGSQERQEEWKRRIMGEDKMEKRKDTVPASASTAAAGANPLPAFSISVNAAPGAAAVLASPAAGVTDDPTVGKDVPHLELPTPPFAKRFRDINFHGYLFLRDRNTNQWMMRYLLLVGTTLRVFESHRASPNDPLAEHEVSLARCIVLSIT
jgi:hypothetical protein